MRFNEQLIDLPALSHVIDHCPLTISPDGYVVDAMVLMSQELSNKLPLTTCNSLLHGSRCNHQDTSCVLVVEGGHLLGILTEKDIVRLSASRRDLSQIKMAEVMTQPVITLKPSDSRNIFTVLSLLRRHDLRHLPIMDDGGQLLGIVTENSLLQGFHLVNMCGVIEALQHPQNELWQVNQPLETVHSRTCNYIKGCVEEHSVGLVQVNEELQQTVKELQILEEELHQAKDELEIRVVERTAELAVTNERLQQEIIERQRAEAALRQSEKLYRQLVENQKDLITRIDLQGRFTFVNKAACEVLGRKLDELVGESSFQFSHPDELPQVMENIRALRLPPYHLTTGEERLFTVDGIRWYQWNIAAIRDEMGEIVEVQALGRDVTDRKQVEESLRESETRLNLALEASHMGIWDWNIQTRDVLWSDNMGSLYGLPSGTLCPTIEDLRQLIHPEDRESFFEAVNRSIKEEREFIREYRTVWPDGNTHWLSVRGQVYYNETGQLMRMIGMTRDISERKQGEQKIREQAALLDIATDAIIVRDLQDQILFWNQGAERIYGWQAQETMGKNAKELLYKKNLSQFREEALKTVIESGSWEGELKKVQKSGTEIILQSRWTLMHDDAGQPKSILIVETDITQKKQLEEQFLRTQRLESLGTLAGGISHDLNNILTPILAAAQLLQGRFSQDQERTQDLLQIIEKNTRRGAALVKQVLSFARGVKGERTIVQLKHLIAEINMIAKQTFPKSIKFTAAIPEELWAISGDVTQLHQVLMNLVVNARDAMPEGGVITISAENMLIDEAFTRMNLEAKVDHYVVMTIADTGSGMSSKILDRIFEPFFTTKEMGGGTGLGLSTALGIIKGHGGFVNVSSRVRKGSQFKLFLPAVQATQSMTIDDMGMLAGNGELILVVDDEAPIRDIARLILETHNYKTLTASNGIEAIALYAQHKHHISSVLMDMMMPEMDGATAICTLQKMNPQVQIIAWSGLTSSESLAQAARTGVQLVLPKPFTAKELLYNLHCVLRQRN